jgi:phosphoribosylamine--glycine ligase
MITPEGTPKVVEFNCRFGDPETQVVLPLLETNLDEILLACIEQRLEALPPIEWKAQAAACVVAAAEGYPGSYAKGMAIEASRPPLRRGPWSSTQAPSSRGAKC